MAETAKHHEKCPCSLGEFWGDKNCAAGCPGCECAELASTLPPTAAEPSEPKADGFDEWFGASGYVESFRPNALEIWSVGEQSGVRKGMQRALELVRKYREGRAEPRAVYAAKDCEASILAEMEKAI